MSAPLRLAVIGCGAVTKIMHIPALVATPGVELTVLVDRDVARAQALARQYQVPLAVGDYQAVVGQADAALVALPNHLHAPVSLDLMNRGLHVYVEKPMALTAADCDAMVAAAEKHRVTLAVGHMRRAYPGLRWVKQILQAGWLGRITEFNMCEGFEGGWETVSDFIVRRDQAGGGVLMDIGVHVLDLVGWWFGTPAALAYWDDARGGLEANCRIELQYPDGMVGHVELSRGRTLRNRFRIQGEHGYVEVGPLAGDVVKLGMPGAPLELTAQAEGAASLHHSMGVMFQDFVQAVVTPREALVSGSAARQAVALIEQCYAHAQLWRYPWEERMEA